MNDDYINSILTLSDESFQETPTSSKSKTIEDLGVISVTASKKDFVEHMVDLVEVGSESVNKLVGYIGEDNAAGAVMVLQVALEGAPKALLSLVGEEILNTVRKPVVDKVSTIIDEKALKTQEIVNKEKKEAYENFSDVLAEFGFDVALGGAYSTIRSAKKVEKASITKGGSDNYSNQITNKNLGRDKPGIVSSNTNNLPVIKDGDTWLKGTSSNAGKIPSQIAEKLNGKEFKDFGEFRSAFWKEVANDSVLSKQFPPGARTLMKDGKAPYASINEQVGKRGVYELDHNVEIQNGGNVYDLNNIIVRTPYNHIKKTSDTKKAN